jgi:3'(2'), 5'-bisphosphate nucleotidase
MNGVPIEPADHYLASSVASSAAELLVSFRNRSPDLALDEADRRSHDHIIKELAAQRPGDAVLSEEAATDEHRLSASRVWVIDPLDGTREYRERRNDWAVHVALVTDGTPVAGALALPGFGCTIATFPPPTTRGRSGVPLRMVVSRTRPPKVATMVAESLGATIVPMGSAGAKAAAVIFGDADIYLHAGGQYEWDSAAPVAVAIAAGLHASRIDGTRLVYNQPDPWLPDLLICRQELAATVFVHTQS